MTGVNGLLVAFAVESLSTSTTVTGRLGGKVPSFALAVERTDIDPALEVESIFLEILAASVDVDEVESSSIDRTASVVGSIAKSHPQVAGHFSRARSPTGFSWIQ